METINMVLIVCTYHMMRGLCPVQNGQLQKEQFTTLPLFNCKNIFHGESKRSPQLFMARMESIRMHVEMGGKKITNLFKLSLSFTVATTHICYQKLHPTTPIYNQRAFLHQHYATCFNLYQSSFLLVPPPHSKL